VRVPFFPDRVIKIRILKVFSILRSGETGAALVRGSGVLEVSTALRALDPWDRIFAMPIEMKLPAAGLGTGERDKTEQSPLTPAHHEVAGFESVALIDLLDFHRFLLEETGLGGGLGFFRSNRKGRRE
jgi:hypothetical protein